MEDLEGVLARQRGVLSTAQAIALVGRPALRWKLRTGAWQRVTARVVVTHSGPLTAVQRRQADLLRAGRGAVLGGVTAAELGGLQGFGSPTTHVLVPPTAQATRRAGLVVHRDRQWNDATHPLLVPRRSRLPRAVVDGARWAGTDRLAVALLLAAVQQRLVRVDDLRAELTARPGRRRAGLIRSTLQDAALGVGSTLESDFLALCRELCVPRPVLQSRETDSEGLNRWVDADWPEFGVAAEIDGGAHTEVLTWWADMKRQNALWISGRRLLRFPGVALRLDRAEVAGQLVAALVAGGWTPDTRTEERIVRLRSA